MNNGGTTNSSSQDKDHEEPPLALGTGTGGGRGATRSRFPSPSEKKREKQIKGLGSSLPRKASGPKVEHNEMARLRNMSNHGNRRGG